MSDTDREDAQPGGPRLALPQGWDGYGPAERRDWLAATRRRLLARIDREAESFLRDLATAIGGGPPTAAEKVRLLEGLRPGLSDAVAAEQGA